MLIFSRTMQWMRMRKISIEVVLKDLPDPVLVLDRQGRYLKVMGGAERSLYGNAAYLIGKTLHDVFHAGAADHCLKIIHRALDTGTIQVVDYGLSAKDFKMKPTDGPSGEQWFQGRISPLRITGGSSDSVSWTVINITEKKLAELERDRAIVKLEKALTEIRSLQGIIPICSSCKKIRDENDGWHVLEDYISDHSDADFSHGICPDCMNELYPGYSLDEP